MNHRKEDFEVVGTGECVCCGLCDAQDKFCDEIGVEERVAPERQRGTKQLTRTTKKLVDVCVLCPVNPLMKRPLRLCVI